MGKQYNKVLKRRRRAAYMTKRKLALRELVKNSPKAKTTKSKVAKPKVARKTVAAKKEKVNLFIDIDLKDFFQDDAKTLSLFSGAFKEIGFNLSYIEL